MSTCIAQQSLHAELEIGQPILHSLQLFVDFLSPPLAKLAFLSPFTLKVPLQINYLPWLVWDLARTLSEADNEVWCCDSLSPMMPHRLFSQWRQQASCCRYLSWYHCLPVLSNKKRQLSLTLSRCYIKSRPVKRITESTEL